MNRLMLQLAAGATPGVKTRPVDVHELIDRVVTAKREYHAAAKATGAAYRDVIGRHYPAMSAVQVSALMEDRARVEIEATAIVPA